MSELHDVIVTNGVAVVRDGALVRVATRKRETDGIIEMWIQEHSTDGGKTWIPGPRSLSVAIP
jgi:hypothetical protein